MKSPEASDLGGFIQEDTQALAHPDEFRLDPDVIERSDEMREFRAKELNLPPEATLEEIVAAEDEKFGRLASAKVLGLDMNATWDDILAAEGGEGDRVSQALILGLSRDASYGEIAKFREARDQARRAKVAEEIRFNRAKRAVPSPRLLD